MTFSAKLAAALIGLASLATVAPASAQVNCNAAPHGPGRARCYAAESQMYRQQAQNYNDIANQQYRQHQQIGQALRAAPLVGRYAAPAWNAPRYINNGYNRFRGQ